MRYNIEDYREYYLEYFKKFHAMAVGEYADLSYGQDTPNGTSSSLESVIAYANYIDNPKATILNAGAGASSWMLRKLFKDVVCIDPNLKYLHFVERICGGERYWRGFGTTYTFDHIYFDYGDIERLPYLGRAIDIARKSIYVDDVDNRSCAVPYRDTVIRLCEAMNLKWFDCVEAKDEYERWGIIIEK